MLSKYEYCVRRIENRQEELRCFLALSKLKLLVIHYTLLEIQNQCE
jgi:hypothetical protein